MIDLLLAGLLLSQTPAPTTPPPAAQTEAPAQPVLPPELALRIENAQLRLALLRAQVEATSQALQLQRDAIDAAVRTALPGYAGIDWQTGQPRKAEAPSSPAGKDSTR